MSWQDNPPFSIDEAQQRGVDVYEVLVSDWGVNQDDVSNLQWPPDGFPSVPVSVAGIAIGPRSTVDRVWVSYDLQKHKLAPDTSVTDRMRRLSVDSPLIFAQPGKKSLTPDYSIITPFQELAKEGPLVILPYSGLTGQPGVFSGGEYPGLTAPAPVDSTVMPLIYVDVNGVERTFSPVGVVPTAPGALRPLLHLLIYLKAPPTFVPTRRFPLILRGQWPPTDGITPDEEYLIAQIPVYGRRQIKLMLRGNGAGPFDFRIGGLRALADYGPLYEEPVDVATGVAGETPVVLSACNGLNTGLDYLNIYATEHQEAGSGGHVVYQFSAYD